MAQFRPRLLVDRRLAGLARHGADRKRAGARAGRRRYPRAGSCRARRRRARRDQRRRPTSSGCGTSARFPIIARSRRPTMPSWWSRVYRLSAARGQDRDRLVRPPGRAGRPHRRRYRHPVHPHRPYPDLDLCRQPSGLARRSRALARRHARGRGQAVRRAARAAHRTFRRSPHQRADAAAARERDAWNREINKTGEVDGRRPCDRPARRICLSCRTPRRAAPKPRRCKTPRKRRWPARSPRAPRGSPRRRTINSCWPPTARCAGPAPRSASSSPAKRFCVRGFASSPTSI